MLCAASALLLLDAERPLPAPLLPLSPASDRQSLSVYLTQESCVRVMSLDDYLCRAVAAEMPASFHSEALKAQAIAARSYVCFRLTENGGSGCASHPEADVCTSAACCQAYSFEPSIDRRISEAVFATSGEAVAYDGSVINALYHACSGGQTARAESVFSEALPYLRSVQSPGEENYPQFASESIFSFEQLCELLPLDASKPIPDQLAILETDESGRAARVQAGQSILSGTQFRKALSLPSTRISLSFSEGKLTVLSSGFGHGVGLSQTGADAMARNGSDYRTILLWYYADCEIIRLPSA